MRKYCIAAAITLSLVGCPQDRVLPNLPASDAGATPGKTGTDAATTGGTDASHGGFGSNDAGTSDGGPTPFDAGSTSAFGTAADPACDLNGYWAGRQSTVSDAPLIGTQFATSWYLLAFSQDGTTVTVVEHDDCGIFVRSESSLGVTVQVARATMETLIDKNPQEGRSGTMQRNGERCDFAMGRFWSVRGASPEAYLPAGPHATVGLSDLATQAPLPTEADPTGAEDWNGPSQPGLGVAWSVSGTATGTRWSVQRDYTEWQSDANHPILASVDWQDVLQVHVRFAMDENVLTTDPANNPLLSTLARPLTNDSRNKLELLFLGRDASDPRIASLLAITDPADRCLELQSLLPHTES